MIARRHLLIFATLAGAAAQARAQGTTGGAGGAVTVLDSQPKAHAVIDSRSSAFFVRFNRPVDHEDSRLAIMRDGRIIEILHPRLESAPDVLFARAPTLPPGTYALHWRVGGQPQLEGEIPFTVGGS